MFYWLLAALMIPPSDTTIKSPGNEIICYFEEEMPIFPGGEEALVAYLKKNIKYPAAALKANVSGTVLVQFIVKANGTIAGVKTVGTPQGKGLEEEAIRVVSGMPKWKPAKMNRKFVDVWFNLPIHFSMPGQAKDALTKHPYITPPSK